MIIFTLIFGVVAYLSVCWIRALQQSKPGSKLPNKTMIDIAYDDLKSILVLFDKKEVKEAKGVSEIKPTLRRGSSASNIKDMAEKERNGLVRANSMRSVSHKGILLNFVLIVENNSFSKGSLSPPSLDFDSTMSIRRVCSCMLFYL